MINFKEIQLEDKTLITSFTANGHRRNCDLSFSNLCSWKFLYHTQVALIDGFLAFKFWVNGKLFYMMPLGEGFIKPVVQRLMQDAQQEQQSFCMLGVCERTRTELEELFPDTFSFSSDRNYSDYLYLRTDLSTLSGKKYQSKRNHVNRFRNTNPDYEYVPITPERIEECLELEAKWCKVNNCDQMEGVGNERQSLTYALTHFQELGLQGGLLRVNGVIVAFTYGMPINGDTFCVHAEKADTTVDGAYAMINYEFANHIPEHYLYINREEDLGIEGLRKAKLSYQPTIILDKYMACVKDSDSL
ncbi:MAG: DUF2156 domain-containing protein [Bacteroides sp.]